MMGNIIHYAIALSAHNHSLAMHPIPAIDIRNDFYAGDIISIGKLGSI
jgi:hypothetical protein